MSMDYNELPKDVVEDASTFEMITLQGIPMYSQLEPTIQIVKDFIIEKKLIIYGGTAIDYALRLKGDKIYPDDALAIPDLDFYSSDLSDPYEVADRLYRDGALQARAINALHIGTMRVDAGDNNFVADISYVPPEIMEKIPTLVFEGMRFVHPNYQRLDVHASLAHPYDNAPREVIFARWGKDIRRFNKLSNYYPISVPANTSRLIKSAITETHAIQHKTLPITGWAAYAILSRYYQGTGRPMDPEQFILAAFSDRKTAKTHTITFDTLNAMEYVAENNEDINYVGYDEFEPYFNIIPRRRATASTCIYDTSGHHPGINRITIGDSEYVITGVQYLLKYFLAMFYYTDDQTYLTRYRSIMYMIENSPEDDVFWPAIEVYGTVNISASQMYNILRDLSKFTECTPCEKPAHYNVERANGIRPATFDPSTSKYFRINGKKITV